MNSKILKKRFVNEYRDFFSHCVKVVSAPHVFFWTGDFSNFYGGLAICSKIPLRFYVGLEKISNSDFEVEEEARAYFFNKNDFHTFKIDDYIINELHSCLKDDLKGYRIKFLSELPLGVSLGGLGAMSACLGMMTAANKDAKQKAISLSASLQRGRKSAATTLGCMTKSYYPAVYIHKDKKPMIVSLDKMLNLHKNVFWPIDFGLIFSGRFVRGGAVISSAKEMQDISQSLQKEAKAIIDSYGGSLWKDYLKMLDHVAHQCLVGMKKIFNQPREEDIAFFFSTLNQYQNLLYFLGISTPAINKIYSAIHRNANYLDNKIGSGSKISGIGRGGNVLFAVPYGEMRDKVEKIIDEVSDGNGESTSLCYASWVDGIESKGLIIEQDISNRIFSDFFKKDMLLLEVFDNGRVTEKVVESCNIFKERIDLMLDVDNGKIFYRGVKVDSSMILSQKATVSILGKLLKSDNFQIKNKEIPLSYGRSRFDLQGKIITPLEKLTGLSFEIRGGTYDDFSLKLKFSNITIGLIKKIS